MFHTDTLKEDDDKESSGNLSEDFEEVLKEPIAQITPSSAEAIDIHDFEENFK